MNSVDRLCALHAFGSLTKKSRLSRKLLAVRQFFVHCFVLNLSQWAIQSECMGANAMYALTAVDRSKILLKNLGRHLASSNGSGVASVA